MVDERRVSNVFLTYFYYFLGVNINLGAERHQGCNPPLPPTNRALGLTLRLKLP